MNPPLEPAIIVTDRHKAAAAGEDGSELVEALVEEDFLVEEVSIDGMCGVY
ncbi:mycofactocin precursor MftA [Dactylosporangium sp. NPDC000244]|uniref:mycofactocin precursor MftA n=1 Tax=Dactylosporangium sp. NPDC000244 TaxID=3154365 RepID=UPI00331F8DA0